MKTGTLLTRVAFGLLPILLSLLVTSFIIVLVGNDPRAVFEAVWQGAFRNTGAFSGVINFWIPVALVSMGLIITFTAGLWNIGVEGQMAFGAVCASGIALFIPLPAPLSIIVQIVVAMLGGILWALLVGILKTRFGVHEIFGGVGLNALANVTAIYLISGPWSPPEGGSAQSTAPFPEAARFPPFSSEYNISLLALTLTLIAIVAVILILNGTRWGLNLRATGKNARSALLLGVPTTYSALQALMACGALAGLAGAYRVMFTYASLRPFVSGGIGFLGLLVVLLVGIRALWTPFVAFAFAAILAGSTRLRVSLQLDQSLAGVLQGLLVLAVLITSGLRQRWSERRHAAPVVVTSEAAPRATAAPISEPAHE